VLPSRDAVAAVWVDASESTVHHKILNLGKKQTGGSISPDVKIPKATSCVTELFMNVRSTHREIGTAQRFAGSRSQVNVALLSTLFHLRPLTQRTQPVVMLRYMQREEALASVTG